MILGIDFGSTTIKIVLMDGHEVIEKYRIPSNQSYTEILDTMDLSNVSKIMMVGAGASYIEEDLYGIKTERVEEFDAVALGGHYLSGLDECMIVSLGTGTSYTYINNHTKEHAGGCGIGGALICSLARYALGIEDVNEFMALASRGDLHKADLYIKDISKLDIDYLLADVTAANMGKINQNSRPEDFAIGVCNLVFQNVGVMAVMADRPYNTGKIVVMGSFGRNDIAKSCFEAVGKLFNYTFIIPEDSIYGVAIGAVLCNELHVS